MATHYSAFTSGSVTVNPDSIANAVRGSIAVTITGIAAGDLLVLEPPDDLEVGLAYAGHRITSTSTVTIYLANVSAAPVNGAALSWRYTWWDRT